MVGRRIRSAVGGLVLVALLVAPGAAQAVPCPLPGAADPTFTDVPLDISGNFESDRQGQFVQIPFQVPADTTAIRVRYSYDQLPALASNPANPCGGGPNTLDIGAYEPRAPGQAFWDIDGSRGWSGSAVRDLAISENRFTPDATYDEKRKAFVQGFTTRAYRPGLIPAGEWAVELGLGHIDDTDVDGIDYRVRVETSSDPVWSGNPRTEVDQDPNPAIDSPGWFAGDLHVHGEMEPGNATRTQTLESAFGTEAGGGSGLDFVTLVDHNNEIAHTDLGPYQDQHPGKLIIPGTEVTTYRGHWNNQGTGRFVEFRNGPIELIEDPTGSPNELTRVRGEVPPRGPIAAARATGRGWSQINHPTIFPGPLASQCRGCAWSYDDGETGYGSVDAIEVQTGPAAVDLTGTGRPIFNPFTTQAFEFYERMLAAGHRIAAVGVSDDHQGGDGSGNTYSPVGSATTMVYADELSAAGITEAIRDDHTYVKLFGNDGPEISLTAAVPDRPEAIIGDSVRGRSALFTATVGGALATGRPGPMSLVVQKDGTTLETVPITSNSFAHTFADTGRGRYSLQVVRQEGVQMMVENYSSPIWFSPGEASATPPGPGNRFKIVRVNRKRSKGTAKMVVRVPAAGEVRLRGRHLGKRTRRAGEAGRVKLEVEPRGKLRRKLSDRGRARAATRVTFAPESGSPRTKRRGVKLILRPR